MYSLMSAVCQKGYTVWCTILLYISCVLYWSLVHCWCTVIVYSSNVKGLLTTLFTKFVHNEYVTVLVLRLTLLLCFACVI